MDGTMNRQAVPETCQGSSPGLLICPPRILLLYEGRSRSPGSMDPEVEMKHFAPPVPSACLFMVVLTPDIL